MVVSLFANFPTRLAAQHAVITGTVIDQHTKKELPAVAIQIEGSLIQTKTNTQGSFSLKTDIEGEIVLHFRAAEYYFKRFPIILFDSLIPLGNIAMERDVITDNSEQLIAVTNEAIADNEVAVNSGILQAGRDIFYRRAAFDFGQAFFRIRGYDSRNGVLLINGIPINQIQDGRPQWNHWGGLNDISRNQEFTPGMEASSFGFGGLLGTTQIDLRPSGLRPGTRITSSLSNRTYTGRFMATHTSNNKEQSLDYTVSASRRWAKEGYKQGTLYDAYSFFIAADYALNEQNNLHISAIYAPNRKGSSAAITEEVYHLLGRKYNPYWGMQGNAIRNSRERRISEPLMLINYYHNADKLTLNLGAAYQRGMQKKSRLGYYDAPNPDPTYYRYLPSFYINNPIGANFIGANLAATGLLENPQLQWEPLYRANKSNLSAARAAYILYDDTVENRRLVLNALGNIQLGKKTVIDIGVSFQDFISDNYARIKDLLGASHHVDIDPFSNTRNDINSPPEKVVGDIFNYRYKLNATTLNGFIQWRYTSAKWEAFATSGYGIRSVSREGLFLNERFPNSSLGPGKEVKHAEYGLKTGLRYKFTGRHWVGAYALYQRRAPLLQNLFINPREQHAVVPDIESELISGLDLDYHFRMPTLTGRISGYYARFQKTTDINFFFVDAGVGSDFVQEVITNLDRLHKGIELGLEYKLSSSVTLSGVASIGDHRYASDPFVSINFDTSGAEDELINLEGHVDLGTAAIKGYRVPNGPQQAYSLGLQYRDPAYWWVGATANYLSENFINVAAIMRTQSFYLNAETGQPYPNVSPEKARELLDQQRLDNFYLFNMIGGKSWLIDGKYISVFASINNLFDTTFRTGGYEQSRNGNYGQLLQDNLSGLPSFGPKYWYGLGRSYFLNVAVSF